MYRIIEKASIPSWVPVAATSALLFLSSVCPADQHWEILNPLPVAGDIVSIDFVNDETGYLITDAGRLMRTTDGGESWSIMELPYASNGPWAVDFLTAENGWVLGGMDIEEPWRQMIYHTSDACDNWDLWLLGNQFEPSFFNSVQAGEADLGWAAGGTTIEAVSRPVVYRYLGEDEWISSILPEGDGVALHKVHFVDRNHGWAAGQDGYLARSDDGGRNWERLDSGTELDLYSVYFTDPFVGWAAGGDFRTGLVLRTTNGGENWQCLDDHNAANRISAIRALAETQAVALSYGGQIPARIIYTSDAQHWDTVFEDNNLTLLSLTKEGMLRVGGSSGFLAASADGQEWERLSSTFITGNAYDIQFLNEDDGWCVGDDGTVLTTEDGGSGWRRLENDIRSALYAVHFRDRSTGWATGQGSIELFTDNGGESWREVNIAPGDVSHIVFSGDTGYAVHGRSVAVSRNGGESWLSTQVIPDGEDGVIAISAPEPDIAYVASPTDSLRRTLDAGESWQAVEAPFTGCLGVTFPNTNYGWVVGVSPGDWHRVYYTEDGGEMWRSGRLIDFLATGIRFIDEEHGWIWGLAGELLYSDDGGRNWDSMGLRVSRNLHGLSATAPDRLWVCGEGGLLARWGDEWQSAPSVRGRMPHRFAITPAWPNPTNGLVRLTITIDRPGAYDLKLLDITGRLLNSLPQSYPSPGRHEISLPLDGLPNGTYLLWIGDEAFNRPVRIVLLK